MNDDNFEKSMLLFFAGAACMVGCLMIFEGMVSTGLFALLWGVLSAVMSIFY